MFSAKNRSYSVNYYVTHSRQFGDIALFRPSFLDSMECVNCECSSAKKKCSHCHVTFYCSEECQKADWGRHRLECENSAAAMVLKTHKEAGNIIGSLQEAVFHRSPTGLVCLSLGFWTWANGFEPKESNSPLISITELMVFGLDAKVEHSITAALRLMETNRKSHVYGDYKAKRSYRSESSPNNVTMGFHVEKIQPGGWQSPPLLAHLHKEDDRVQFIICLQSEN